MYSGYRLKPLQNNRYLFLWYSIYETKHIQPFNEVMILINSVRNYLALYSLWLRFFSEICEPNANNMRTQYEQ